MYVVQENGAAGSLSLHTWIDERVLITSHFHRMESHLSIASTQARMKQCEWAHASVRSLHHRKLGILLSKAEIN